MSDKIISLTDLDHYFLGMLIYGVNIQFQQPLLIMANQSELKVVKRIMMLAQSLKSGPIELFLYQDFKTKPSHYLTDKAQAGWAFLKLNWFERFIGQADQAALMEEFSRFTKSLSHYSQHGLIQSCSSVIPSLTWARSMFEDLSDEDALAKLSNQLVKAARCDQADYLDQCAHHYADLTIKVVMLNKRSIQKLSFKSKTCDLTIGLNPDHVWVGGPQYAKSIRYLPNFPTQEVFTVNSKHQVDGWFRITRPFRFKDQLISDLKLVIQNGEVIDLTSTENIDAFKAHLYEEKSRRYFGEIALVDQDNPIAKLESVFNCVLLDENAVCHIALGSSYPVCSFAYDQDRQDDLVNHSDLHLDLMIGSDDLIIKAFDGKTWFLMNR